jgi:hypothetical protein
MLGLPPTHQYTHFLIFPKIKKLILKNTYKNLTFNKIRIESIQHTYFVYCIFFSIRVRLNQTPLIGLILVWTIHGRRVLCGRGC